MVRAYKPGLLLAILVAVVAAAAFLTIRDTGAGTVAGFEIDADEANRLHAMYSGNSGSAGIPPFFPGTGPDWAEGTSGDGVFELHTGGGDPDVDDCYLSDVDVNDFPNGSAAFFCDGNSDSRFTGGGNSIATEPENDVVSPSGKTQDNVYPVTPGNVPGKNDFSHAYFIFTLADSVCDEDTDADDPFMIMAGHRGGNEGSAFWGFELNQVPPFNFDDLKDGDADTFDLIFRHSEALNGSGLPADPGRSDGDVLVSFTLVDGGGTPILEVFTWDSTNTRATPLGTYENLVNPGPDTVTPLSCPEEPALTIGGSALATNSELPDGTDPQTKLDPHSIEAPPWNVPACDPTPGNSSEYGTTGDGGPNTCRLASGSAAGETGTSCNNTPADCHLLPTLTFAEAAIDMNFFGISDTCFNSLIFTSRSSQTLGDVGSDLKDIGGGEVDICGTKEGRKFEDMDGDGTDDGGEDPGIEGWTINLYEDDGDGVLEASEDTPIESVQTGSDGSYSFGGLNPGFYIVCEEAQSDWVQTFPDSGDSDAADCTIDSTLAPVGHAFEITILEVESGNDFGNFELIDKSGVKVEDIDGDGDISEDSAELLEGWDIKLYEDDGDGVLEAGDTLLATDTTDSNGEYSFPDLGPGDYIVCEVLKDDWFETFPASSDTDAADCTFDATFGEVGHAFSAVSGEDHTGNDFGNFEMVDKSGNKFEDEDGDGNIAEDSAQPLDGWDIKLYEDDGDAVLEAGETTPLATDTTDATGEYKFEDLGPGDYIVCEVLKDDWVQTFPTSSETDAADCSEDSTLGAVGHAFNVTSGTDHTGNDFGNFQLIDKTGTKYDDADGDGDVTSDGTPIEGWNVRIYDDSGSAAGVLDSSDALLSTVATDATGLYTFPDLGPGTFHVCEELPDGWIQTAPSSGTDCTVVTGTGAWGYTFTTTSGDDETLNDFANFKLITKSGNKYEDRDGDGDISEDTDFPLEDWVIRIYKDVGTDPGNLDADDELHAFTTTDSSGAYEFPDLGPGDYLVCEGAQAGWEQTYPTSGADCSFDPANSPLGYPFTALSGIDHLDNDFGNAELFRLIIITCSEADETLVVSEVDLDPGTTGDVKDTIGTPPALTGVSEADLHEYLCNLGGAEYDDLPRGTYNTDTELPKVP